jgi:hypothetical protein
MPLRPHITTPDAWSGPAIQQDPAWICYLDDVDIAEINAALALVKRSSTRIPFPSGAFPLPSLQEKLDDIIDEIENGRGFKLIRGIPTAN